MGFGGGYPLIHLTSPHTRSGACWFGWSDLPGVPEFLLFPVLGLKVLLNLDFCMGAGTRTQVFMLASKQLSHLPRSPSPEKINYRSIK